MALRLSPKWIQEYCPHNLSTDKLAEVLSRYGLETEVIEDITIDPKIIIGEITSIEKHPDADKLNVCKVSVGSEVLQIVCGCPTVVDAKKVLVAPVGTKIPGMTLKPVKLRGVESQGMICSLKELGLAEEGSGIYHVHENIETGTHLIDYLKHDSQLLEIDITPNRGDCLSIYGIARDLSAVLGKALAPYPEGDISKIAATDKLFTVSSKAVSAYDALVGEVDSSARVPLYMENRLRQAGMGLNHTVVDILNYVMLELGQPMHAFDQESLTLPLVMQDGSSQAFTLLNDESYQPNAWDTLVCDQKSPQALAGIMGGMDSRMQANSKRIQLESAVFAPWAIAKSLRKNKLQSDASYRYERGVSTDLNQVALRYSARLLAEYAGATFTEYQSYQRVESQPAIVVNIESINQQLGLALEEREVWDMLTRIGITQEGSNALIPPYRYDITQLVDLVEEVARLHGYDNIPLEPMVCELSPVNSKESLEERLKYKMPLLGYREVVQFSFVSEALLETFPAIGDAVEIANPINSEYSFMRTQLIQSLVLAAQYNYQRQIPQMKLFETGEVFRSYKGEIQETKQLAALCMGDISSGYGNDVRVVDFYDMQALLNSLLSDYDSKAIAFTACTYSHMHPKQSAQVLYHEQPIGYIGMLHPKVAKTLNLPKVGLLSVDLTQLPDIHREPIIPPSKYPSVSRDITVSLNNSVSLGELERQVLALNIRELKELVLKDIYSTDSGKNVTWSIQFQSYEGTLKDKTIDGYMRLVQEQLSPNS